MKPKLFVSLLLIVAPLLLWGATSITENHWQVAFNKKGTQGKLEVSTKAGRVDILTDEYAIEVGRISKYEEGIEQALRYAKATNIRPSLALYRFCRGYFIKGN